MAHEKDGAVVSHSPLPWLIEGPYADESCDIVTPADTDKWVGEIHSVEDAEFICRAVNAHADLLAACKEFVRKCDSGEARSKKSYAQMKAAIAKAEGHE